MSDIRSLLDVVVAAEKPSGDALQRIQELIARRTRRRRLGGLAAGLGALAAGTLVLISVVTGNLGDATRPRATGDTGTVPSTEFPPGSYQDGASTFIPVTLPDGTAIEVVFPSNLSLGQQGGRVTTAGGLGAEVDRTVDAYFSSPEDVPLLGDKVLSEYEGSGGEQVLLIEGSPAGATQYLVYHFEPWTVLVFAGDLSDDERRAWATNLVGEVRDGWVVLSARGPLFLAAYGDPNGPQLWLSGTDFRQEVGVVASECVPDDKSEVAISDVGETGWFASWCDVSGSVRVHAYGGDDRSFVEAVLEHLSIRLPH